MNGLCWSADGKSVFVQVDDHGITKVVAIALDGKVRELVSGLGGMSTRGRAPADPRWSQWDDT